MKLSRPKKNERKSNNNTPFEADRHIIQMRLNLTQLIGNNFGVNKAMFEKKVNEYAKCVQLSDQRDDLVYWYTLSWEDFINKVLNSYKIWMTNELRNITSLYKQANSIFPCGLPFVNMIEFIRRRDLLDQAISHCQAVKFELNFLVKALPVSFSKYKNYFKSLKKEISILKGIRQSDTRFIKPEYIENNVSFSADVKEYATQQFKLIAQSIVPLIGLETLSGTLGTDTLLNSLGVINGKDLKTNQFDSSVLPEYDTFKLNNQEPIQKIFNDTINLPEYVF